MPIWKLTSLHHTVSLDVVASDDSPMKGTLTFQGKTYSVSGAWAASGVLGRKASAFGLSGGTPEANPTFIAATGIMTGDGPAPARIDIQIDTASSPDGTREKYKGALFPG